MKRIGVLTSGGDAPGMNAAIRAVTRAAINQNMEVVGIRRGYAGLMEKDVQPLDIISVGGILQRGGTILKTARALSFMEEEGLQKGLDTIEALSLDTVVAIGGDGTFRGASALANRGIKVMGIPGTIDNDMGYTDFTIGFDTAVNTVIEGIARLKDTALAHNTATIVEVMGRHCGDIALYSGITGGAEYILTPEIDTNVEELADNVHQILQRRSHCIIIRAEGFAASTEEVSQAIARRRGEEPRKVVLGYLQRGGSPTARDRMLATRMGHKAVELIAKDADHLAIGISGNEITYMDMGEAVAIKRQPDLDLLAMMYDLA